MSAPIIQINNLKNYIGGQWVHDAVDLTINKKEIIAIVGGSGAGKTVLFRSILMLHKPTDGSIEVFGQEIINCTRKEALSVQHRWGVMFQHSALFSALTVLENVMFPLRTFTQLPAKVQREIALLKISLAGLDLSSANKYPSELSGGMQKRAALARAIVMDPELLFLDEPTAGLDPMSADAFDNLILQLRETLNLTIVMITHDVDSLWQTTDRVIYLGQGKILAAMPIGELTNNPNPLIQEYFSGPRGERRGEQ